jgi:hypothetical protein
VSEPPHPFITDLTPVSSAASTEPACFLASYYAIWLADHVHARLPVVHILTGWTETIECAQDETNIIYYLGRCAWPALVGVYLFILDGCHNLMHPVIYTVYGIVHTQIQIDPCPACTTAEWYAMCLKTYISRAGRGGGGCLGCPTQLTVYMTE